MDKCVHDYNMLADLLKIVLWNSESNMHEIYGSETDSKKNANLQIRVWFLFTFQEQIYQLHSELVIC